MNTPIFVVSLIAVSIYVFVVVFFAYKNGEVGPRTSYIFLSIPPIALVAGVILAFKGEWIHAATMIFAMWITYAFGREHLKHERRSKARNKLNPCKDI